MESATNTIAGTKPKPHARVTHHKPVPKPKPKPQAQDKHLAGVGYDDSIYWKVELDGFVMSVGTLTIPLPTARKNLLVHLRWSRSKLTNMVTKADVYLEQEGIGFDVITYMGSDKLDAEHGKTVNWYQHTVVFDIHFTTTAVPIPIDFGQTHKISGLDKLSSSYSGIISGWYDIASESQHIKVIFL